MWEGVGRDGGRLVNRSCEWRDMRPCHEAREHAIIVNELISLSPKPEGHALPSWLRKGSGLVILSREPARASLAVDLGRRTEMDVTW